jgi:hypothetical protein
MRGALREPIANRSYNRQSKKRRSVHAAFLVEGAHGTVRRVLTGLSTLRAAHA